ncbi:tyrosine recombinase XerC [uncultured Ruthenibacterium sp.]|uniref:tyrosine recombinase XerC n=1 Tax=uncultured Ruthenibacterium sp. TaxID=1905347 RepID=UPI00349E5F19
MSSYIDSRKPNKHGDYKDCPALVVEFLYNSETIRGLSPRTVNGYYIDLRTFFRFLKLHRGLVASQTPLDEISISEIDLTFIESITTSEIYEFLHYVTRERDNGATTRARKLSSLKGFFRYLCNKKKILKNNPTDDVETPAIRKRLPKYLSLSEGVELLKNIQSDFYERDYCIITLFLNCGMRLSELVNINITDLQEDGTIRIIGKGDKERLVYLNNACKSALHRLCVERAKMLNLKDEQALFVSKRTGKRLSARRVQQIVEKCLGTAGLSGRGFSPHKLRHTAATMMYQEGHVDMLALKEILGHAHVSTTEIYTHLGNAQLKEAAQASPFANIDFDQNESSKKQKLNKGKKGSDEK